MIRTKLFDYSFQYAANVDIGEKRSENQDEIICCPELGFFAVSDGMGGLYKGGETSKIIAETLPQMVAKANEELQRDISPERAAAFLNKQVKILSDLIYINLTKDGLYAHYGATLCGVWLAGNYAIYINLGDSRGYILPYRKKCIRQITSDHNVAAELVEMGELSREQALLHPSNASLTRFMGMKSPAIAETFVEILLPGDRLLLCSDGLYSMVDETSLPGILRFSKNPVKVAEQLIAQANLAGGRDNIAAVYIKIGAEHENAKG